MRDLQILIFDGAGGQLGELDLTDSDDFALKLTKSIASINDLGRRNTSFSLDFEAPQTKNNNKLLAGLRFATASKEILGQKECSILVDGNQVDRGFLYPYESEFDGMYKLVFKGLNNDWVERLRDVELNQLEWLDYQGGRSVDATEFFDPTRVTALNTQTSHTADIIYPLVNRNNDGTFPNKRPQIHLRSIILQMFDKIGYTVSSAWLESDWVKAGTNGVTTLPGGGNFVDKFGNPYTHLGLSVDPAFQMTRDPQDVISQAAEYSATGISFVSDPATWIPSRVVGNLGTPAAPIQQNINRFPNQINTLALDENARFDTSKSEYTIGLGGFYSLEFFFNYQWAFYDVVDLIWRFGVSSSPIKTNGDNYSQVPAANVATPPNFKWYIVKNNTSDTAIDGTIIYQYSTSLRQRNVHFLTRNHFFNAGDKISIFLELIDDANGWPPATFLNASQSPSGSLDKWKLRIENDAVFKIALREDVQAGDVYRINDHIPEGVKCISLLQDFKTMFNLYFDTDVNRKIVFIEPRDDFFTGVQEDITEKVDLSNAPVLNYLTSYKNEIVFQYNEDSEDKYLKQWNKINYKTYAEYKYLLQNNERFDKGQTIFKTNVLSASIQGNLDNKLNYPEITSLIKEEYLDADNVGKPLNKNYSPRVFQLVNGKQYDTAGVLKKNTVETVAIMENYANTPTYNDNKLTFIGTNGLVQNYYAKTLANIEDTAVIELSIHLTLYDFISWDLKKTYYISEPAEIAGYYITDKIPNFNVTKEGITRITLVKFKDYTPATVQGGVGNVNVITQNTPQPTPILCTVNGVIVDCLDNNLQQMFKL